jgi:RNA-directed DNA polymerase
MQATGLANGATRPTEWQGVDWRAANRQVRNLRRRIFRASQAGDWATVRSLQTLMLRSYSNTLVSVRRVTQVNRGRNTAGIDKLVATTPATRGRLVDQLMTYQPWRAKPARRVYIPKANHKLRPLGIPTVLDRCLQARVKNALEPVWEARFEGSSYGFRPGRSQHDAIAKIYNLARPNKRKRWVVDADIKGAFDHIDHACLLDAIGAVPGRGLIAQWLKAGYIDQGVFHDTLAGTGQGAVISPLLANVALHGLEDALGVKYDTRGQIVSARAVVRYADDFVVFCESKEDAEHVLNVLNVWLAPRGLTLSEEKTHIVHLTEGFDFLGFNVRHYAYRRSRTGYKLLIKPSKGSVQHIRDKLRDAWNRHKGKPVATVTRDLNPIIRGEANYYRIGVASETFNKLDRWMFVRECRYARFSHPRKSKKWRTSRYWGRLHPTRNDNWVFGDKHTGAYLLKFGWFNIRRHVLVKGTASPDDPRLRAYWAARDRAKARDLIPSQGKIAHHQGYTCRICGETLFNGEELQKDHIEPRSKGGKDAYNNLMLVHLTCHHQKTASERSSQEPTRPRLRQRLA